MRGKKLPDKRWVGKIIEITKSGYFAVIEGSPAYSIYLHKGQRLKVIGRQEGNWLRCKLISSGYGKIQPGVQMSEFDRIWQSDKIGLITPLSNINYRCFSKF